MDKEPEAGGAAFSIRQSWTDTRENAGRKGENMAQWRPAGEGAPTRG